MIIGEEFNYWIQFERNNCRFESYIITYLLTIVKTTTQTIH